MLAQWFNIPSVDLVAATLTLYNAHGRAHTHRKWEMSAEKKMWKEEWVNEKVNEWLLNI